MLSADLVREQLQKVLASEVDLDDFEDWIVSASWNMHKSADHDVQNLVGAIERQFAIYSDELINKSELFDEFGLLLQLGCYQVPMQVQMVLGPPAIVTSMTSIESAQPWSFMISVNSMVPAAHVNAVDFQATASGITRTSSSKTIIRDILPVLA